MTLRMAIRAVFFGTPAIAVPALSALSEVAEVVAVVCQPDRPAGRGMKLRAPAVKEAALARGLPVHQPVKVRTGNLDEWVRDLDVDVALVMAYGRILPVEVLDAPRIGCLNLHASILPRYRGAAPINRALMAGETQTGISLMQMDAGLDTGPVLAVETLDIGPDETASELAERLAQLAAEVTRRYVPRAVAGELTAEAQDETRATHAPPLSRADGHIDWSAPAATIVNQVRGLALRPGAFTRLHRKADESKGLRILRARLTAPIVALSAGEVGVDGGRLLVGTGDGLLEILEAQLEGKRSLSARDLINGRALGAGDVLGDPIPPPG